MSDRLQHFLLVFDHEAGVLLEVRDFGVEIDAALAAYAAKENELRAAPKCEVVLIGSDSIETVKLTHANYFDGTVASKYLVGI
jgi:hypothetical protein